MGRFRGANCQMFLNGFRLVATSWKLDVDGSGHRLVTTLFPHFWHLNLWMIAQWWWFHTLHHKWAADRHAGAKSKSSMDFAVYVFWTYVGFFFFSAPFSRRRSLVDDCFTGQSPGSAISIPAAPDVHEGLCQFQASAPYGRAGRLVLHEQFLDEPFVHRHRHDVRNLQSHSPS